jgi:hypothetical protein
MATAKQQKVTKPSTEVAVKDDKREVMLAADAADTALFQADSGRGMEGTDADSFAIPFLTALQKGSPQVDETVNGGADLVEGAKAGMLYESVSKKIVDGKKGVLIVPCAFRRVFLRWGPRGGDGAGFKGELSPERVAELRANGKGAEKIVDLDGKLYFPNPETGEINPKKNDRVADTRNHYVLIVDEETGDTKQALMSLTSTQIKKSKALMALLAEVRLKGGDGKSFTPPTYANLIRVTTTAESNDQGSWYGVKFEREGTVSASIYAAAKAFHGSVLKGHVEVKYEDEAGAAPVGAEHADGKSF